MRNLELLPVEKSIQDQIRLSRDKLFAFAGIKVDILEFDENKLRVRVEQTELKNNFMLNQSQLVSRAGALFAPLDNKYKIHYVALTYSPDLSRYDHHWVNDRMAEFKISRNDLIKQMGIDKATLSELLSGNRSLTKFQKAAFFYYFMTYELNRDVREYIQDEA